MAHTLPTAAHILVISLVSVLPSSAASPMGLLNYCDSFIQKLNSRTDAHAANIVIPYLASWATFASSRAIFDCGDRTGLAHWGGNGRAYLFKAAGGKAGPKRLDLRVWRPARPEIGREKQVQGTWRKSGVVQKLLQEPLIQRQLAPQAEKHFPEGNNLSLPDMVHLQMLRAVDKTAIALSKSKNGTNLLDNRGPKPLMFNFTSPSRLHEYLDRLKDDSVIVFDSSFSEGEREALLSTLATRAQLNASPDGTFRTFVTHDDGPTADGPLVFELRRSRAGQKSQTLNISAADGAAARHVLSLPLRADALRDVRRLSEGRETIGGKLHYFIEYIVVFVTRSGTIVSVTVRLFFGLETSAAAADKSAVKAMRQEHSTTAADNKLEALVSDKIGDIRDELYKEFIDDPDFFVLFQFTDSDIFVAQR